MPLSSFGTVTHWFFIDQLFFAIKKVYVPSWGRWGFNTTVQLIFSLLQNSAGIRSNITYQPAVFLKGGPKKTHHPTILNQNQWPTNQKLEFSIWLLGLCFIQLSGIPLDSSLYASFGIPVLVSWVSFCSLDSSRWNSLLMGYWMK